MRIASALILLLLAGCAAPSPVERTAAARAAFVRANPCPATGLTRGACPGWVVDHIEPLCAGGADTPANMQWQTVEDSRGKDVGERARCKALRRADHGR